jgi:hypothetical protein
MKTKWVELPNWSVRSGTEQPALRSRARPGRHPNPSRQTLGALGRRTHRCKSSAAQINLFGAALTAPQQAKPAEQNGGSVRGYQELFVPLAAWQPGRPGSAANQPGCIFQPVA